MYYYFIINYYLFVLYQIIISCIYSIYLYIEIDNLSTFYSITIYSILISLYNLIDKLISLFIIIAIKSFLNEVASNPNLSTQISNSYL
jgi:hypothetical protein